MIMKKALLLTGLLFSQISTAVYTPLPRHDINVVLTRNITCTAAQFRQEAVDFSFLKGYRIKELSDTSVTVFLSGYSYAINNDRIKSYNYSVNYPDDTVNAKIVEDRLAKTTDDYRRYFSSFLSCTTPVGLISDETPITFNMSPEDANVSEKLQDYISFESAYPSVGAKPTIALFDTVIYRDYIYDPHFPRITGGKSFIDGVTVPILLTSETTTMPHANAMLFNGMMVSDANVYPLALIRGSVLSNKPIAAGTNHLLSIKDTLSTPVANWSFSRGRIGNDDVMKDSIKKLHDAGIPVIQAIGNSGEEKARFVAYDPNVITVGYTTQGILSGFSSFGKDGPDLLVEQSGEAPEPNKTGGYTTVNFTTGQSSGATALVSGIVSRMRNTCPKTMPDEIKSTLIETAIKYTGPEASFVTGGYINPKAALDKLKTLPSCSINNGDYATVNLRVFEMRNNPTQNDITLFNMGVSAGKINCPLQPGGVFSEDTPGKRWSCTVNFNVVTLRTKKPWADSVVLGFFASAPAGQAVYTQINWPY